MVEISNRFKGLVDVDGVPLVHRTDVPVKPLDALDDVETAVGLSLNQRLGLHGGPEFDFKPCYVVTRPISLNVAHQSRHGYAIVNRGTELALVPGDTVSFQGDYLEKCADGTCFLNYHVLTSSEQIAEFERFRPGLYFDPNGLKRPGRRVNLFVGHRLGEKDARLDFFVGALSPDFTQFATSLVADRRNPNGSRLGEERIHQLCRRNSDPSVKTRRDDDASMVSNLIRCAISERSKLDK